MRIRVKKLRAEASLPNFAHLGDACADVCALEDHTIEPGETYLSGTGLAFEIPRGFELIIRPRSGLSIKHGLTLVNSPGTVDSGYRGEVLIALRNDSSRSYTIGIGDRIAQVGIRPVPRVTFCETDDLRSSRRGTGGFGSTGR